MRYIFSGVYGGLFSLLSSSPVPLPRSAHSLPLITLSFPLLLSLPLFAIRCLIHLLYSFPLPILSTGERNRLLCTELTLSSPNVNSKAASRLVKGLYVARGRSLRQDEEKCKCVAVSPFLFPNPVIVTPTPKHLICR